MWLFRKAGVLALLFLMASSASAWAFGGIGCTDLPDYDRATGALEGMSGACDMSIEEARQIHAAHDGVAAESVSVAGHRAIATRVLGHPGDQIEFRRNSLSTCDVLSSLSEGMAQ